jgi:MFS family permease
MGMTGHNSSADKPYQSPTVGPGAQKPRFKAALRALNYRNFKLFMGGQVISLVGTWMQTVAQSWLVYRLTGSSFLLGSVAFVSQIPVFLLAPIGGAVADRFDRHKVVITTQIVFMVLAFTLSLITILDAVQIWHIFLLSSLIGVVTAFDMPARQSFIAQLVDKKDLMSAIALNSSMFNSARIIGPAIAGILVAIVGEGWCFFANGTSFVAVIVGLLMMKVSVPINAQTPGSTLNRTLEGFRFVRRTAALRNLLLLLGLASVMGMPYTVLMPIFARQVLGSGARGLGILLGATGVGALLASISFAARTNVKGLGRLLGTALAGFGLSLILFAFSRSFWLSVLLLLPAGFCQMMHLACTNTLLQTMAPDRLRGRLMAIYSMMLIGMAPFGAFFSGLAAQKLGAPVTVSLGGAGCLLGALGFLSRLHVFRPQVQQLMSARIGSEFAGFNDGAG